MNRLPLSTLVTLTLPGLAAAAGQLTATIEIPRLDVAEYHRPYVAAWIESEQRDIVANLALWYDLELPDREGETWLKDLRQWWRKSGRELQFPIDGVSTPTKPVGQHQITFDLAQTQLPSLGPGTYYFVVEASREVGGRELVRIPFQWSDAPAVNESAIGERELGKVALVIGQ